MDPILPSPIEPGAFLGRYRARVRMRIDPDQLYRVRVQVFGIHDQNTPPDKLPWAFPKRFGGHKWGVMGVPPLDTLVWVEFEGGDHEYPVYDAATFGPEDLVDGEDENEHVYFPTNAYGGKEKRSEGILKSEDEGDPKKAPDMFGFVSPMQKRLELDDRMKEEKIVLADQLDNFVWINTEKGITTLEMSKGLENEDGQAKKRGITLYSEKERQAVQIYTFEGWKLTIDDTGKTLELISPAGNLVSIKETDEEQAMEFWTAAGHKVILDDLAKKVSVHSREGRSITLSDEDKKVIIAGTENKQSIVLDDDNQELKLYSEYNIKVETKGDFEVLAEGDIKLSPKGLLLLDEKEGEVTVEPDDSLEGVIETKEKPELLEPVPRACDT